MKIKRIVGVALAALMALSLTVPVMAAGRDETITGEGKVGLFQTQTMAPTIHGIEEDDTLVYGTNADKTNPALQENVPGATVTVTWPNNQGQTQAIVDATGRWQVSANGISLKNGDRVRAVQQESGKTVSLATVAIVGEGPGTVEEKSMAPTIGVTDTGAEWVRGTNLDKNPGQEHLQENVPGSEIVVTWPDGTTGTTTVNNAGFWELKFTRPLVKDEQVKAVQIEADKLPSDPTVVTVGSGKPGVVDPPPVVITDPENYLVLSVPAEFEWYVNQTDPEKVQSGKNPYEVTVYSLTLPDVGVFDARVDVALKEFAKTNSVSLGSDLVLNFTGDIGTKVTGDISNGLPLTDPVALGRISSHSGEKDTLTFGFGGTYGGKLTSDVKVPTYNMVLNFTLVDTTAPIETTP